MANGKNIKTARHNFIHREGGDFGLFFTLIPKVLVLFVCLTTLGTFIEFSLDGSQLEYHLFDSLFFQQEGRGGVKWVLCLFFQPATSFTLLNYMIIWCKIHLIITHYIILAVTPLESCGSVFKGERKSLKPRDRKPRVSRV